jgi:hypothetical protein
VTWPTRMWPYSLPEPTLPSFGRTLAVAQDLDGDGGPDLAVGAPSCLGPEWAGAVYAISGRTLAERMKATKTDAPLRKVPAKESPHSLEPAASISIRDLGKLATFERWVPRNSSSDSAAPSFGRVLVSTADLVGPAGDDLVASSTGEAAFELVSIASEPGTAGEEPDSHLEWIGAEDRAAARLGGRGADAGVALAVGVKTGFSGASIGKLSIWFRDPARPTLDREPASGVSDALGRALADAGDVDGDGFTDILVAGWDLRVVSGRTGGTLEVIPFQLRAASVPRLLPPRDLDGDGKTEIVVAEAERGRVSVLSGTNREPLRRLERAPASAQFGAALHWFDDRDGDGAPELLIGAPGASESARGEVHLISGRSGATLATWRGERPGGSLGRAIVADDDLDGDGAADIAISAPGGCATRVVGAVYVIRGSDLEVALRIDAEVESSPRRWADEERIGYPVSETFAWSLATGDFDADGLADLALGSPVRSGEGDFSFQGDVDGDGRFDFAARAQDRTPIQCVGRVELISGRSLREALRR